jgi:hypothetical protein
MTTRLKLPSIKKGATYSYELTWLNDAGNPVDLTDCTAEIQVRSHVDAATALLTCTTANGRLTITELTGKITINLTDEVTALLEGDGGEYDLFVYHPDGTISSVYEGIWLFKNSAVRA